MDSNSRIPPVPWDRYCLRRYTASERLRKRILDDLGPRRRQARLVERLGAMLALGQLRWPALGAGFAAGVLAGALSLNLPFAAQPADPIAREVVSNHVRSLMADHLSDVVSSDAATVRSWFRGRLEYAPRVADLSPIGYSLVGGRLDYVADRPVAALVYSRAQHLVNVFACPLQGRGGREERIARNGFHAIGWSDSAMQYWAVADMDSAELEHLAETLRDAKPD